MKIPVLKPFRDAETKVKYETGQIIDMTKARYSRALKNLERFGGGFLGNPLSAKEARPRGIAGESVAGRQKLR